MLHAVLTIRRSSIAEIRANEHGLCEMNVRETHGRSAAIDWTFYAKVEADGCVDVLASWWGDQLVGYCVAMLHTHPQTSLSTAVVVAIFALPGFKRSGFALRRMLALYADIAKAGGAASVSVEQSMHGRLGPLLMRMGYRPVSVCYEKAVS